MSRIATIYAFWSANSFTDDQYSQTMITRIGLMAGRRLFERTGFSTAFTLAFWTRRTSIGFTVGGMVVIIS